MPESRDEVRPRPRVRRASSPADFASAAELLDRFNREFDCPTPGPDFVSARLAALDAGETLALLAAEAGEDAGVAVLRIRPGLWSDASEAYLAELYVTPERRRHGLGTELLGGALDVARELGCDRIELGTDEGDHDAHRLYERHGFSNFTQPDAAEPERMYFYERDL